MISFENFSRLIIFICLCTLHSGKAEYDGNGVHGEIDPMPIPEEKFPGHFEVSEKLKRSLGDDPLDEIDDGMNPRSYATRYLPREFFEKGDQCNYDHILKMHKKCLCHLPRKKCVRINNPHGTVLTTMPECVIVDRCEGVCPFSTNCVPKESQLIDVQVMVTSLVPDGNGDSMKVSYECRTIQVEKHVKCGCACEVSEKDCSPEQVFKSELCQCQCPNPSQAEECKKQNMEWNPVKCECSCPPNISQECSSGAFFHKTQCKCVAAKTERAWKRLRI